jgi:hypothetical protein
LKRRGEQKSTLNKRPQLIGTCIRSGSANQDEGQRPLRTFRFLMPPPSVAQATRVFDADTGVMDMDHETDMARLEGKKPQSREKRSL